MSFKAIVTFVLAAGFVAAKPISHQSGLSLDRRQIDVSSVINGFNRNDGAFNFIDGFNNFNKQQKVIQIQQQKIQIVDDRSRQQIVQQIQQVLIVDQVNNGFNNDLNNLFRKSNFQNQFRDRRTDVIIVQEIIVVIDDGRGGRRDQSFFAQNTIVANRGGRDRQSVMIFDSRKLIANDILRDNAFDRIGRFNGIAGATGPIDGGLPLKTRGYQIFDERPRHANIVEDPAAILGAIWQGAVEDLQRNDEDENDNKLNELLAAQELEELLKQKGNDNN
ncbi:hypothetical protein COCSADRAFT_69451, partial [Bipolaris sorokiniana ND90Pr]